MPRYKLTIAYDGTDFCGWQKQEPPASLNVDASKVMAAPAGGSDRPERMTLRTVQEVVERAVREVVREPVELTGASRTDAGVHARGQVAAFTCTGSPEHKLGEIAPADQPAHPTPPVSPAVLSAGLSPVPAAHTRTGWPLARGTPALLRALNSRLPDDVLIVAAEPVQADFNPIASATAKAYSYTLHISPHRPLWDRRYVHHIWVPLDVARMQEAAAKFTGEHDFAAFAAAGHGRMSTVRTIFACDVEESEGTEGRRHGGTKSVAPQPDWPRRLRIEIAGNGFLWNMVRIIAGTLAEVGRGKLSPEDVAAAIESGDRRRAGPTLPPTGLCLEWIRYG